MDGWRDHRVKLGGRWNGGGEGEGTLEHFAVQGTITGRCFLRDSWLLTGGGAVGHEGWGGEEHSSVHNKPPLPGAFFSPLSLLADYLSLTPTQSCTGFNNWAPNCALQSHSATHRRRWGGGSQIECVQFGSRTTLPSDLITVFLSRCAMWALSVNRMVW